MIAHVHSAVPARPQAEAILLVIAAMSSFSCMDTLSKLLTATYDPVQVTWARYTFHALPMLLLFGPARVRRMAAARKPGLQIVRSLAFLASALCAITAFTMMSMADLVAISFLSPLLVVALSVVVLGERVGVHRWTAVACGFAGVLIMVWPSGGGLTPIGSAVALASTLFWAIGLLLTRQTREEGPLTVLFYTAVVGALVMTLAMPFFWTPPDLEGWAQMLAMGLVGMLSHTLLITAYQRGQASVLAPFQYSQILLAVLLGWMVFGDVPEPRAAIGAAIIVASGLYAWHRERRLSA